MLSKRNLDDQTYKSIVDAALGRLPWLCPSWTDHNAHDPGITVLELLAWYKEMQQYQINQFTDQLREKLLKLVGVYRRPASAAVCSLVLSDELPGRLPLSRLISPEGVQFELMQAIPARRMKIEHVMVGDVSLWEILRGGALPFQPFAFGGQENTELRIALSGVEEKTITLCFEIEEPDGAPRNPFAHPDQQPRTLLWTLEGFGEIIPDSDETHALSQSGAVVFKLPSEFTSSDVDGLLWLSVRQTDPGCEETVRLSGISASRWQAVQQQTRAKSYSFAAPRRKNWSVLISNAMANGAQLAVFLRVGDRWVQQSDYEARRGKNGLRIRMSTVSGVIDGEANVFIACLDGASIANLLFDTLGVPGETLYLQLEGQKPLTDTFTLWCETLDTDGEIRILPWRCVDDLAPCSPRERVFCYDPVRETITFGDGEHGAVVRGGEGAVLVTDLTLSMCGGGNIPAGAELKFIDDDMPVGNRAATGGRDRETVIEASARFLRELGTTEKCASCEDYERLALTTPGLRVKAAKALPGYDPDNPAPADDSPTVTVIVVPSSGGEKPLPDERFLSHVNRRLQTARPVCTNVKVIAPVYEDINVSLSVRVRENVTEQDVRELIEEYLSTDGVGIGGVIVQGELMARLQALNGVVNVRGLRLGTVGYSAYQNSSGDILMPKHGIARLNILELERIPEESAGR